MAGCAGTKPPFVVGTGCCALALVALAPALDDDDDCGGVPSFQPAAFALFPQVLPQYGSVFPVRESCHRGFMPQNGHVPCALVLMLGGVTGVGAAVAGGRPSPAGDAAVAVVVEGGAWKVPPRSTAPPPVATEATGATGAAGWRESVDNTPRAHCRPQYSPPPTLVRTPQAMHIALPAAGAICCCGTCATTPSGITPPDFGEGAPEICVGVVGSIASLAIAFFSLTWCPFFGT